MDTPLMLPEADASARKVFSAFSDNLGGALVSIWQELWPCVTPPSSRSMSSWCSTSFETKRRRPGRRSAALLDYPIVGQPDSWSASEVGVLSSNRPGRPRRRADRGARLPSTTGQRGSGGGPSRDQVPWRAGRPVGGHDLRGRPTDAGRGRGIRGAFGHDLDAAGGGLQARSARRRGRRRHPGHPGS